MIKFCSSELLTLLSEVEEYLVTFKYSSIFEMIKDLRSEFIFCDLSMRDFEDLRVSYPDYIQITVDDVKIDISEAYQNFQHNYMWEARTDQCKKRIIESCKKYLVNHAH